MNKFENQAVYPLQYRWLLLSLFGLMCLPLQALADPSTAVGFTPPSSDYSVTYLENLFGNVDGVLYGTGSQMMGAIFKVFNGAVLALGGIVITYTLLVGTMNTAHEGKMLGQKWNSIWVPIRSTVGLALLLPKTSGYCLMQISMMWITVQGVGAADKIWNAALDYLNAGGVIIRTNITAEEGTSGDNQAMATGAIAMLAGQTCMFGLETALKTLHQSLTDAKESGGGACAGNPSDVMKKFCDSVVPDFMASFNAVKYQVDHDGDKSFSQPMPNFESGSTYAYLNGICGSITWNPIPQEDLDKINNNISGLSAQDTASTEMSRATAVQQMYLDLATTAKTIVNNDPKLNTSLNDQGTPAYPNVALKVFGVPYLSSGDVPCTTYSEHCVLWGGAFGSDGTTMYPAILHGNEMDNAVAAYNAVMASTVELIDDANDDGNWENGRDFIEKAKTSGWLTAGSYFFDLVYLNGSAAPTNRKTDTGTGLESSVSTPEKLLTPFQGDGTSGNLCTNPATQYNDLCEWYGGNSTAVNDVLKLINSSATTSMPSANITAQTVAAKDQEASTVYGFEKNALLMVQPNEPPISAPEFTMHFNFKFEPSLFSLPKEQFDCGSAFSGGKCVGRMIANAMYNKMLRGIFNFLLLGTSQLMGLVVFAVFAMPLAFFSVVFKNGMAYISDPGANPIVSLAHMGTAYINYSFQMYIDLFTITTAMLYIPVWGSFLFFIGATLILIASPILIAWSGIFIAIGFSTAYYVPFLPYLLFVFGVIGWLMAVIEAMVAAPIVALGMTHPEGDGALGKADHAIMILMNVFLRPAMMIIGYLAGIALCYVSIWILNSGFQHIMQFIQGDSETGWAWKGGGGYTNWAGIYAFFFSILLYTTIYITLAQKAFDLIFALPDHVMTWIGGPASQVGEKTAQWGEETKGKVSEAGKEGQNAQAQVMKKAQAAATEGADKAMKALGGAEGAESTITGTP